jgi:CHAD domain-containing protein
MAKPIVVEGLEAPMPLEEAAARLLPPLLGDALARELAVRSGDPELGIHDMRVAMKRFREMFRLLRRAFAKKRHRRHLEWIEDLNDALGEVRDQDVLVAHLVELAGEEKTAPAIATLLERLLTKRDVAFHALLEELDRIHERGLRTRLEALIVETASRRDAGSLGDFVRGEILERLERVRRRWRRAHAAATEQRFHDTRIANKRLRYAIEPFRALLPAEVSEVYATASDFHDALGDLHDGDVLLETVRTALMSTPAGERAPLLRLLGAAEEDRRKHLAELIELGDKLEGLEWDRLAKAVAPTIPAAPNETAPAKSQGPATAR